MSPSPEHNEKWAHFTINAREGNTHADGRWFFFDEHGKLEETGEYRNNRRVGIWKRFHSNGRLSAQGFYYSWNADSIEKEMNSKEITSAPEEVTSTPEEGMDSTELGESFAPVNWGQVITILGLPNGEQVSYDGIWEFYDTLGNKLYEVGYEKGMEIR